MSSRCRSTVRGLALALLAIGCAARPASGRSGSFRELAARRLGHQRRSGESPLQPGPTTREDTTPCRTVREQRLGGLARASGSTTSSTAPGATSRAAAASVRR